MTKWLDLYEQKGIYVSQEYDVSSNFEAYLDDIRYQCEVNDGSVDVFVRLSYDSNDWTEWVKINDMSYAQLFRDEYYNMEYCKFQYKAVLVNNGVVSPKFLSFSYSLTGSFIVNNTGDVICKPELWLTKKDGSGSVKLINETNGQVLILSNLNNDEQVYIDCENEDIETNLPLKYRYDDHNNVFLELEVGENLLSGEGDFELTMRYEFKLLQG